MEVELHPEAREELENFQEEVKDELKSRLRELEDQPGSHENSDRIEIKGRAMFKYVMKEGERGGKIDHRAVYDIGGDRITVYAVFHRDKGYQKHKVAKRF